MSLLTVVLSGVILGLAAVVQGAVGFGYALFATPLLVWVGIPLQKVIVLVAIGSMVQSATGVRSLHTSVPWREALTATAVRMMWVLVGLFFLKKLVTLNPEYIQLTVGCLLCLLVVLQFFWRPHPVEKVHWSATLFAFSASGILAGMAGMGGPPLVLWAMAHNWSAGKTRGFFFAAFLTFIPLQIVLLCLTFGFSTLWPAIAMGFCFAPVIYGGSLIGLSLGHKMSKERLTKLTYLCLLVTGISAILSSL